MGEINVLSLSYGKDSLACLGACEKLGWKIDRIIHAEVWATDEISADLPPMLEFKKKADAIIKERYGLEVEHICAMTTPNKKYGSFTTPPGRGGQRVPTKSCSTTLHAQSDTENTSADSHAPQEDGVIGSNYKVKLTYQDIFYRPMKSRERERERANLRFPSNQGRVVQRRPQDATLTDSQSQEEIGVRLSRRIVYGYPSNGARWCQELKPGHFKFSDTPLQQGADTNTVVQFLGIAADEPKRIERHINKPNIKLPLVEVGWTEADCRKWCEENDLLSPIYTTSARGGVLVLPQPEPGSVTALAKELPRPMEVALEMGFGFARDVQGRRTYGTRPR